MRKTEIMLSIQERLAGISDLKYIDKDWGQLNTAVPAVNFPCCLIDVESVNYEDGRAMQNATATIVLTIANHRTVTSSIMSPDKEKSYYLVNLTESIAGMLHLFTNGNYAPLVRTLWKKVETGTVDYECYEMRFSTAYKCDYSPRKQKIDVVPNVTVEQR